MARRSYKILVKPTSFRVEPIVSNVSACSGSPSSLRLEKALVFSSLPDLHCFDRPKPQDFVESMHTLLTFFNRVSSIKSSMPTYLSLRSDLVLLICSNYSTQIAVIKCKSNGALGAVYAHVIPMGIGY